MTIRLCQVCGDPTPPNTRRPRLRCSPCQRLQQQEWNHDWRTRNPDRVQALSIKQSRKAGHRPKSIVDAERRERVTKRAKKIATLLEQGLSCAQAAKRLGITKNTVIGAMDRARRYGHLVEAGAR